MDELLQALCLSAKRALKGKRPAKGKAALAEYDVVRLRSASNAPGVPVGAEGTILIIYPATPPVYEVEFVDADREFARHLHGAGERPRARVDGAARVNGGRRSGRRSLEGSITSDAAR